MSCESNTLKRFENEIKTKDIFQSAIESESQNV